MVYTKDYKFPSDEELTVEEIKVGTPVLYASGPLMGRACDDISKEFILCRQENTDPRKCLAEGRAVTACGLKFLQQVKKHCGQQVQDHANCLEWSSSDMHPRFCRKTEAIMDKCVFDNMGIERPHLGYYSSPRIHQTQREKPIDPIAAREYKKPVSLNDASEEVRNAPARYPAYNF